MFIVFLLIFLTSCDKFSLTSLSNVWLEKVSWIAEKDANNNVPIKLHIVYFYDEAYMKKIVAKTSIQYFEQYQDLKKDFPSKVEVIAFDVVPGTAKETMIVTPAKANAKGGVIFARYNTVNVNQKYFIGEDFEIRMIFKKDHVELIRDTKSR